MDFALIMFLALIATGLIWGADRLFAAPTRERKANELVASGNDEQAAKVFKEPVLVEYARAFFPVILVVFLLRSFLVEPFRIPSGSMLPSLRPGDFILVNKFSYGVRLPVINKKIIGDGIPSRGDVMVFRYPGDTSVNYIKRVVGLPGDHILYMDKTLYINGKATKQYNPISYMLLEDNGRRVLVQRRVEELDGVVHDILVNGEDIGEFVEPRLQGQHYENTVPPGHYFVMGDNRDRSNDSRYWGFVPDNNLVGRAFLVWFSLDQTPGDKWIWNRILWNRIGESIQ